MRDYPGTLPLLNPVSDDLDRALRFCRDTGILGAGDVAELTTRRNALRADLLRLAPDVQALTVRRARREYATAQEASHQALGPEDFARAWCEGKKCRGTANLPVRPGSIRSPARPGCPWRARSTGTGSPRTR